jgi:hypothetical protein
LDRQSRGKDANTRVGGQLAYEGLDGMKDHHVHKPANEFCRRLGDPASGHDGAIGPVRVGVVSAAVEIGAFLQI